MKLQCLLTAIHHFFRVLGNCYIAIPFWHSKCELITSFRVFCASSCFIYFFLVFFDVFLIFYFFFSFRYFILFFRFLSFFRFSLSFPFFSLFYAFFFTFLIFTHFSCFSFVFFSNIFTPSLFYCDPFRFYFLQFPFVSP